MPSSAMFFNPPPALQALCMVLAVLLLGACGAVHEGADLPSAPGVEQAVPVSARSGEGNGIGGTGEIAGEGNGIGGTGTYAGAPGIGGTGVVGAITGFGSIFVNGYEIDYAPNLAVANRDGSLRTTDLRVGQVVAVEATGSGKRLRARSIAMRHEVAGPIESIDAGANSLTVMGQRVALGEGAATPAPFASLRTGQHIDVSGFRRADGLIVASRLDRSAPGASAFVRGRVTAIDSRGFLVNGLRVTSPAGARAAGLRSGQEVAIAGTVGVGGLRARRVEIAASTPFGGRVSRLSIEGYAREGRGGELVMGGVPLRRLPGAGQASGNERVIMEGTLDRRGRFRASTVRPAPLRLRPGSGPNRARPLSAPRKFWRTPQRTAPRIQRPTPQPRIWRPQPAPRWQGRPPRSRR